MNEALFTQSNRGHRRGFRCDSCWDRRVLVALALLLGIGVARGQEPDKKYAKEYHHAFKGDPPNPADIRKMGPSNAECVKFEPEGLRITLPQGLASNQAGTGVTTGFGVSGDFEITIGYEILQEPEPADAGAPTRLALVVVLDKANPNQFLASLNRRVVPKEGRQYFSWLTLGPADTGKREGRATPAKAKSGRLRLLREGDDLSYLMAEGDDDAFKLLAKFPLGAEDLKEVRIVAAKIGKKAAIDVRVLDLHIRAAALPTLTPKIVEQFQEKSADRGWLMAALLIGTAIVVFLGLAAAAAFVLRRRRQTIQSPAANQPATTEAAAASVAVACAGCGKRLKAKAEWAGRKVKCPQCGKAVAIPTKVSDAE